MKKLTLAMQTIVCALIAVTTLSVSALGKKTYQVTKPEITFNLPSNMEVTMPDKEGPKGLKVYSYMDNRNKPNRSISVMVFKLDPKIKSDNMDKAMHDFATGVVQGFAKQQRLPALARESTAQVRPVLINAKTFQMATVSAPHLYTNVYSVAGKEYIYAFVISASNQRALIKLSQVIMNVQLR